MKQRIGCIFLTVFFAVCCLFGCGKSDEELVRERIDTFVTTYNDGDFDGVLECFDTKTRKTLEATFNLMGGLIGGLTGFSFDLSDFFTLGVAMMDGDVLAIEVSEVSINGEQAVATAQLGFVDIGKESIEDVYITLVKENGDWFIQDMQEDAPTDIPIDDDNDNDSSNSSNSSTQSDYVISKIYEEKEGYFIDGHAWVNCVKNDNDSYFAYVDTSGKIKYSEDYSYYANVGILGKGGAFVLTDTKLKIIGADGTIKGEFEGDYQMKAYGGGYAWVYRDASDISTVSHQYGIVDYNGNWVEPLENKGEAGLWDNVSYVGEGLFAISTDNGSYWNRMWSHSILKLTAQGRQTVADLSNVGAEDISFNNGISHIVGTYDSVIENGSGSYVVKNNFILYADGTYKEIDTPDLFTGGKALYVVDGYYQITDCTKQTPTSVTFTKYPASQIKSVEFVGDYGLITISGMDGKDYFTVIDAQGQEQYEPKTYDSEYSVTLLAAGNVLCNNRYYSFDIHYNKTGEETSLDCERWDVAREYFLVETKIWGEYDIYKADSEKLFAGLSE